MLFGKGHINKAISSILLVALLLIHSVKLLHSHPVNTLASKDIHSSIAKNSPDCNICSYQLAKDTDTPVICNNGAAVPEQNIFNPGSIVYYKNISYSAFESRGPPSCI